MAQGSDSGLAGAPTVWRGRSGRSYRLAEGSEVRRGSKSSVRPVVAVGPPVAGSTVPVGTTVALKLPWKGNPEAPDALDREANLLRALGEGVEAPPCPRLIDVLSEDRLNPGGRARVTGLVLEWCSSHLERWWIGAAPEPDAFGRLCEVLAEICARVGQYQVIAQTRFPDALARPAARIKPRNLVAGPESRWVIADFEEARIATVFDEHLSATQPLMGGENFLAPEVLFGANRSTPAAVDTWSLGCSFYALLRLRSYLRSGAVLPGEGTNSPHFRTHRMHLVTDLHTRKPGVLMEQDLDPSLFLYPDRLPDQDRRAVMASLEGVFGTPDAILEGQLARDVVRVLDRALQIDPARRYGEPADMARDFQTLASRFRELSGQKRPIVAQEGMSDEATQIMAVATTDDLGSQDVVPAEVEDDASILPPPVVPPVNLRALKPSAESVAKEPAAKEPVAKEPAVKEPAAKEIPAREPAREPPSREPLETDQVRLPQVAAVAAALVENRLGALERRLSDLSEQVRRPPPTPIPTWIYAALGALGLLQLLTIGVLVMLALAG